MWKSAVFISISLPLIAVILRSLIQVDPKVQKTVFETKIEEFLHPEDKLNETTIIEKEDTLAKYNLQIVKCIKRTIEEYRKNMVYGDPKLGIIVQDPAVPEKDFTFTQDFPMGMAKVTMAKCSVLGLSKFVTRNIVVDMDNHFIRFDFYYPKIPLMGELKILIRALEMESVLRDHFVGVGTDIYARVIVNFDCNNVTGAKIASVEAVAIPEGDMELTLKNNPYNVGKLINTVISVKSIFMVYKELLEVIIQKNLFLHMKDFAERYYVSESQCMVRAQIT